MLRCSGTYLAAQGRMDVLRTSLRVMGLVALLLVVACSEDVAERVSPASDLALEQGGEQCARTCSAFERCSKSELSRYLSGEAPSYDLAKCVTPCEPALPTMSLPASSPCETRAEEASRLHRLQLRRLGRTSADGACEAQKDQLIISHRGASEFAREGTLEAFRATFALGGDGNELDLRFSPDGTIYNFHDDILQFQFFAWGETRDRSWASIDSLRPRHPGPFGASVRVPTLFQILRQHRDLAGYLLLDFKNVTASPTFDPNEPFK